MMIISIKFTKSLLDMLKRKGEFLDFLIMELN